MVVTLSRMRKTRYLGSACTGVDGAVNRVLTHSRPLLSNSFIFINGRMMHETDEYTVTGADITFLTNTFDADIIVVEA